jgi:hypothetical protein
LPATTALRPGNNTPSPGPLRTDVTSGAGGIANPGYGSYSLPPNPGLLARIVASDPNVMAAQLAYNTGAAQGDTGVRQLASTLAAQYGDPQFASDLGVNVFPETVDLARSNTLAGHSTLALLNLANQHAMDALYSHLAATGLLHSGEVGFEQGLEGARDSLARFNALTSVQNQLQQGITANVNTQQTLRDAVTNAINKAQATGNLPGPTNVTVGSVPGVAAPHLGGATGLAPGTYFNAAGSGTPNYQLAPSGSLKPNTYFNAAGAGAPNYQATTGTPFYVPPS